MKTRICKLNNEEFILQRWVPHFLWKGHWEGIQYTDKGHWYSYESYEGQKKYCVLPTQEEAEELLTQFQRYLFEKELATK